MIDDGNHQSNFKTLLLGAAMACTLDEGII